MTARPAVTVASTRWEYGQGRQLIGEYLDWALAEADLDDIATVQASAIVELADVGSYYAPPDGHLLLGWLEGNEPVGVCGVKRRDGSTAEIKRMYVRPSARRRGLARAIATAAMDAARELRCRVLVLESHRTITANAIALYRSLSFVESDRDASIDLDGFVTFELDLLTHQETSP